MSTISEAVESVLASREVAERIAAKAEEVREACARAVEAEPINSWRVDAEKVRATPLDATPLADENRSLLEQARLAWERHAEKDRAYGEALKRNEGLVAALEKFKKVGVRNWNHGEECGRTDSCEESDEKHPCDYHDGDPCPSCECGMSELFAADDAVRAALAKNRGTR